MAQRDEIEKDQYDKINGLTAEVEAAPAREIKAAAKAAKKDLKTFQNACKDTEKARDKSSDEWKQFFQGQLDQAAAAREEDLK